MNNGMIRRLILLRHGETNYNAVKRMQGQLDTDLSPRGIEQAKVAATILAAQNPLAIISSDLRRASDTAQALSDLTGVPIILDPRLRETDLGEWQGKSHKEVDQVLPGARARWRNDALWAPPGGETRLDVAARGLKVIHDLHKEFPYWGEDNERPIVIVSHGGFIAAITAGLLELPVDKFPLFNGLGNTSWVQLSEHPRYEPGEENEYDSDSREWTMFSSPTQSQAAIMSAPSESIWRLDVWNAMNHIGHDIQ